MTKPYHRPPDGYSPPTRCESCQELILYGPVIGGPRWAHLNSADHEVVMRPSGWWDVATGLVRYGVWGDRDAVELNKGTEPTT